VVITEYTLFEVYSFSALERFHDFYQSTLTGLVKARTEAALFTDVYRHALLKACGTICQVFLRFMDAG